MSRVASDSRSAGVVEYDIIVLYFACGDGFAVSRVDAGVLSTARVGRRGRATTAALRGARRARPWPLAPRGICKKKTKLSASVFCNACARARESW